MLAYIRKYYWHDIKYIVL